MAKIMEFDRYEDIKLANKLNITENKLLEAMLKIGLNPKPLYKISKMRVDFAFPDEKIAIEINGPYHNSEEQKIKDKKRWFVLDKEGWKRRTFSSDEVYSNPEKVARVIKKLIKPYAEQETVSEEELRKMQEAFLREIEKQKNEK